MRATRLPPQTNVMYSAPRSYYPSQIDYGNAFSQTSGSTGTSSSGERYPEMNYSTARGMPVRYAKDSVHGRLVRGQLGQPVLRVRHGAIADACRLGSSSHASIGVDGFLHMGALAESFHNLNWAW